MRVELQKDQSTREERSENGQQLSAEATGRWSQRPAARRDRRWGRRTSGARHVTQMQSKRAARVLATRGKSLRLSPKEATIGTRIDKTDSTR